MTKLELKIPPVLLVMLFGVCMYALSAFTDSAQIPAVTTPGLAFICAAFGLGIVLAGVLQFRIARTTVDPTKPEAASALVTNGIYKITRNPMYLGFLFLLLAWAFFLSSLYAALIIPGFILYMNRFQIIPEERALTELFGNEFTAYTARVRRWI